MTKNDKRTIELMEKYKLDTKDILLVTKIQSIYIQARLDLLEESK